MDNKLYIWQMIKEAVKNLGGRTTYSEIRNYIRDNHGEVNESSINCQIVVCTVNHPSRIHYPENKKPRAANSRYDFLFTTGRGQVELYDPEKHGRWEICKNEFGKLTVAQAEIEDLPDVETAESTEQEQELSFPIESHLRDFIGQNIGVIRVDGETVKLYIDENGREGIEYPTDVGRIDVLAVDKEGSFVVFETKLSRGSDKAMGQISRYMGWVKIKLAGNKRVKGVIVAKRTDENLKYAVSVIPNISLFEYELNFKIREVSIGEKKGNKK